MMSESKAQFSSHKQSIPGVKQIIAVASGKGGVGKSTVTANLALALQAKGKRVGILDADIYGPSQAKMMGATTLPEVSENKTIMPVICHGIQTMSIAYLVDQEAAMIWRGPMVSSALQQLIQDTQWNELDILLIDLPPGTGDIQLTLAQKIPVDGSVVVTTPQDIALIDVKRAIHMFDKVKIPVFGIVENMAVHRCGDCGHEEAIFGTGGAEAIAQQFKVPLLGQLPLAKQICLQADNGQPTVVSDPTSPITDRFLQMAQVLLEKIGQQQKRSVFPKIVVEQA